ncbi:hypothetical protein BGX28_004742 [Mortierella sp. GBA30]|nr:hypothetical protein BGX28_004742 [Mortierella sp. GBA30]
MKSSASIAIIACLSVLLASQKVVAKPSIPIEGCLSKVVVPSDGSVTGCEQFAEMYNITFKQLRKWNTGLHENCDNLDTNNEMCVEAPEDIPLTPTSSSSVAVPTNNVGSSVPQKANEVASNVPKKASEVESVNVAKTADTAPEVKTQSATTRPLYPNLTKDMATKPKMSTPKVKAQNEQPDIASNNAKEPATEQFSPLSLIQ